VRFRRAAYRAHDPRWSWTPLSGEGARRNGGRFNAKGVPALYLSLTYEIAVLEASQGFPFRFVPPLTIVSYEVDCEGIIDLTTPRALATHQVRIADLRCTWKRLSESGADVPSQRVAESLRTSGAAGILVPSFAPRVPSGAGNLVLWKWGAGLPHKVRVYDPDERLPRNDASWRS